jgi:hypothetical protein
MKSMLKVALIDDNEEYGQALALRASQIGLNITHCTNLRDGIQAIKNDSEIGGLILDGHCKIDPDTPAADDFLPAAQREVDILASSFDRYLYVIINSAYPEKYESIFKRFEFVHKTSDNTLLLQKVQAGISALDESTLRQKYQSELSILFKLFPDSDMERKLLTILRRMHSMEIVQIKNVSNTVRQMMEPLIDILWEDQDVPAESNRTKQLYDLSGMVYRQNGRIIHNPLSQEVFSKYMSAIALNLWKLTSILSHHNNSTDTIPPTKNTSMSATYMLLELINWVGKWMDDK